MKQTPEVIGLSSDSEDTQIQRKEVAGGNTPQGAQEQKNVQPKGVPSFLADRAEMEKKRLERQKHMRPDIYNAGRCIESDDENDQEEGLDRPPVKRLRTDTSPQSEKSSDSVFWDGELRQTANFNAEPRNDGKHTFRLTEILGKKSDLSFAILSSYALDISWIYQFFDASVPVIIVAQPDETGRTSLKYVFPNWLRTTPYLRGGRGCMHMKFMLLFYKTGRLRVVISTANLIAYDFRDMENSVWLQDLPLRSNPVPHEPKSTEDFPSVLQAVLYSLNVAPALKNMLGDQHPNLPIKFIEQLRMLWDWSKVKVHLVPSIAGTHNGWPNVIRTGHPRLMKVVRNMGLRTGNGSAVNGLQLECQGSSIGTYTTQWFNEFYYSAQGESAEDWLDDSKRQREKLPYPMIKVVYPTKGTVQQTKLGEPGGGTVFCRRKQWAAKNFPKDHFYDSKSKAGSVLMHSKMIIATFRRNSPGKAKYVQACETDGGTDKNLPMTVGWVYVGSHNFTPSAWGTLSGTGLNPRLNINNYELGIMFPLEDENETDRVACFERPPRKYTPGIDEPWMQEDSIYHQV